MAAASPIPVSDDAVVSPALASAPSLVDVLIAPDAVPTFLARANPEQMRIVAYEMETDAGLAARLLRARKGDVEKALTLLGEIAKWRVDMGVRELALTANAYDLLGGVVLDELQPFHSKTYWPYPDKQGRPIYLERTGSCDPSMMQSLVDLDKLERHHIYTQETDVRGLCALASKAAGRAIVATTSILDMNGISMKVAGAEARAFVKRCSAIDSANYPETLGTMLIINAPGIFTAIWSMVKGFLDERTVAKIQILGGPSSWMPKLEELVDKDKIPEEYGGTLKIPGGLFKPSRTNKVQLSAGKDHTVEVPITEAGGKTIRFKWMCKPADLKFSVDFVSAADGTRTNLSPPQSYKAAEESWVTVVVQAPAAGTVVGLFDNKAGWRQRELWCRTDVMVNVGGGQFKPELALTHDSIVQPNTPSDGPFSAAAWAAYKDEMAKRGPGPTPAP